MEHPNQYAQAMKAFNSLYAVWSPDKTSIIKPGICGYFDNEGDWNTIIDLREIKENDTTFTKPPQIPEPRERSQGRWGPVCSEGVSWAQLQLEAPIPIPDAGIKFETKLEFTKQKGYGASLVTGPNVSSTFLEHPKTLFRSWARQNYKAISERYPDVKDHGLWIITKTYHTKRCAISSWSGLEQSACLYLGAGSLVGNTLTLHGAVGEKEQSGVWRFFPQGSKDKNGNVSENRVYRVVANLPEKIQYTVFVGGLRYQASIVGPREVPITVPMRGKEEDEFTVDIDDGSLQVVCEDWSSE